MAASSQDPNVDSIAEALHSAAIRLLRLLRKEDAAAGLTGPQLSALSVLVFAGPQRLGALAAVEQVSLPTMSRLVSALEQGGLAMRSGDPADRRASTVVVTGAGRALLHKGRELRLAKLVKALARLSAADQRRLARAADLMLGLTDPG